LQRVVFQLGIRTKATQIFGDERGSVIVEMAIAVPVFLLICLGILGWGYFFLRDVMIQSATMQAARCMVIPKVNGVTNPYCGYISNSTYQSYGMVESFGIVEDQSTFSLDPASTPFYKTQTVGSSNYKYACVLSTTSNPFAFLSMIHMPTQIEASACRPIQQQ
jgi:Flp pilus assembly protein TadG